MAVTNYLAESGETLFRVYVNVRSKASRAIRSQRKISGIRTEREALREETRLVRECEREIQEEENKGESWGSLVDA